MNKLAILTMIILTASLLVVPLSQTQAQTVQPQLKWSIEMVSNDIAVSNDGNYIAAVNDTGLYYFSINNPSPLWWWPAPSVDYPTISVAISADGNQVAAGLGNIGYLHYFNNANTRTGQQTESTWVTNPINDPVFKGSFAMSQDGQYIAICGSGEYISYYDSCTARTGPSQTPAWSNFFGAFIEKVVMSANGEHLALAGRSLSTPTSLVAYYNNAKNQPYPTQPTWIYEDIKLPIADLEMSQLPEKDIQIAALTYLEIHYWAHANTLTGNPEPTWTYEYEEAVIGIDTAQNQDTLIAFSGPLLAGTVYCWEQASQITDTNPDWLQLENIYVTQAAITDNGNFIAAATQEGIIPTNGVIIHQEAIETPPKTYLYFYDQNGNQIGNRYELTGQVYTIAMSKNAETLVTGGLPMRNGVFITNGDGLIMPPTMLTAFQKPQTTRVGGEITTPNTLNLILNQLYLTLPIIIAAGAVALALIAAHRKLKK